MFLNCGGVLTPDQLETTLRTMFSELHENEEKTKQAIPSNLRTNRQKVPRRRPPPTEKNHETVLEFEEDDG